MKRRKRGFRKRHPPVGARPGTLVIGDEAVTPRMHVIVYGPDSLSEQDVSDATELQQHLREGHVCWIDVQGLGDERTMRTIGDSFKIHPLALEDIVNVPQRPKVEAYEHHLLLIMRMMRLCEKLTVDREQLTILVGENYVLTIQERHGDSFDGVRSRIRQGGLVLRSSGPAYLAYALLDAAIDAYYPILETFGEQLEETATQISESPEPATIQDVHTAKRELLAMRRAVWPLREIINSLLRGDLPFMGDNISTYLRDCYDHTVQVIDIIETYRELAGGLMDLYLSSVANRQNEVMKTLTIMASIFIPLSFLAGLYGMNFQNMPELGAPWGYPALLVIMALVAGGMVRHFYRKGWLGRTPAPGSAQDEVK